MNAVHYLVFSEVEAAELPFDLREAFEEGLELLLGEVLEVCIDRMREKLLPAHPLRRVDDQHLAQDILCGRRDGIDLPRDLQPLKLDALQQLDDVFGVERRKPEE